MMRLLRLCCSESSVAVVPLRVNSPSALPSNVGSTRRFQYFDKVKFLEGKFPNFIKPDHNNYTQKEDYVSWAIKQEPGDRVIRCLYKKLRGSDLPDVRPKTNYPKSLSVDLFDAIQFVDGRNFPSFIKSDQSRKTYSYKQAYVSRVLKDLCSVMQFGNKTEKETLKLHITTLYRQLMGSDLPPVRPNSNNPTSLSVALFDAHALLSKSYNEFSAEINLGCCGQGGLVFPCALKSTLKIEGQRWSFNANSQLLVLWESYDLFYRLDGDEASKKLHPFQMSGDVRSVVKRIRGRDAFQIANPDEAFADLARKLS